MVDLAARIDALNPPQKAAVLATNGPLLVVAGAGSGKTRVITHRIAHLIANCGVAPWEIFAATFTNKAAEEMRERVAKLVPAAEVGRLAIATFHSLCVGILRREATYAGLTQRFSICDDSDQMALIKDCMRNLELGDATLRPEQARNYIATAKIMMLGPEAARQELGDEMGPACSRIYAQYQERLLASDAVDFDDLILHVVHIFQKFPEVLERYQERWKYVLVDEYQDTNKVQFELVHLLALKHGNICAVGDEDQCIYSWRGAEIENLLKFPELFAGCQVIRLEQNYRSTETILDAASAVIAHNEQRMGKELWSERGHGQPITMITGYSEREEAAMVVRAISRLHGMLGIPYNEIAIFYRVNALSRVFEDYLRQQGIGYRVIGGIKFYDRAEVKDLLAYLRVSLNPRDSVALNRVINKPVRGIGATSLAAIYNEAVARQVSVYEILLAIRAKQPGVPKVSGKALKGIEELTDRLKGWNDFVTTHEPAESLKRILRDTNYEELVCNGNDIESISRRDNIAELVTALEQFGKDSPGASLEQFLERVALVNAQDEIKDDDMVSLMTLHCAKGLEYRVVFLVGMEEPIFPSARAVGEKGDLEEERRLFYVGITRAKDMLFLSRADSRSLYGRPSYNPPSLFLREVPGGLVRTFDAAMREISEMSLEGGRGAGSERGMALREELRSSGDAPKSGGRTGEIRFVPVEEEEGGGGLFPVGTRVMHGRLGAGEIMKASGEGARRKVMVKFDAGLQLEILEQFGGLQVLHEDEMPF